LECGPCWQTVLQHKKTVSKQMILCVAREHTALERVKTRETRGQIITWGTREAGRRAAPGGTAPLMVATTKQQQLGETWTLLVNFEIFSLRWCDWLTILGAFGCGDQRGWQDPAAGPFFVAMSPVRPSQIENWNQRSRTENDLADKKVKFGKVKKKKNTNNGPCEQRSSYATHHRPCTTGPLHTPGVGRFAQRSDCTRRS